MGFGKVQANEGVEGSSDWKGAQDVKPWIGHEV